MSSTPVTYKDLISGCIPLVLQCHKKNLHDDAKPLVKVMEDMKACGVDSPVKQSHIDEVETVKRKTLQLIFRVKMSSKQSFVPHFCQSCKETVEAACFLKCEKCKSMDVTCNDEPTTFASLFAMNGFCNACKSLVRFPLVCKKHCASVPMRKFFQSQWI